VLGNVIMWVGGRTCHKNEGCLHMNKLNDKAFKILSLMLLAEQPLTTKKLSELVGYPRKTTEFVCYKISDSRALH